MTCKEKKELLGDFLAIEKRIKELEEERKHLANCKTEKNIKKIETISNLIDDNLYELLNLQEKIMIAIRKLPRITEQRIIHLKYIGKIEGLYHKTLPLWEIANELGYSPDHINHMHGDALQHLEL